VAGLIHSNTGLRILAKADRGITSRHSIKVTYNFRLQRRGFERIAASATKMGNSDCSPNPLEWFGENVKRDLECGEHF
jgi:hypothetical protein